MIMVRLIGGLGNQMFQYAAATALAHRLGVELVLDTRGFESYNLRDYGLSKLNIKARLATQDELNRFPSKQRRFFELLNKFIKIPSKFYIEPFFQYNKKWNSISDNIHLSGYFQSEKYFFEIRNQLLNEFMPTQKINAENANIIHQIKNSESVCVHVRRGDYITEPKNVKLIGFCSLEYYKNAILKMQKELNSPNFFVFSNDLEWARNNLPLGESSVFVDGNLDSPEIDMFIMSQCRHHIVANSSFSWWGAWLNNYENKRIIAPNPWFESPKLKDTDLLPLSWCKIPK